MKDSVTSPNSMMNQQSSSISDSLDTRSSKSISDVGSKRSSFDYSGCQMHCQLLQPGFVYKKKVNVYFQNNRIIISSEAYAKKPKKIIELGFHDMVKWNIQKSENQVVYTGMTIQLRKEKEDKSMEKIEEIEFFGDSIILEQVKDYLRRFIFQSRIQDEYIIQAQIGKGNYARVFSARHRGTGTKIALKCFEKEKLRKSENGYKSLEKEIRIMQTIGNHPSLLEFIGSYEGENTFYVAMGLIEGNSLYCEIKKRKEEKFPIQKIKAFMKQIVSGVHHFAQFGIMHRDLKPENIMFKRKDSLEELVIVDFGLAEFQNSTTYLFSKCGTPGYVAPEVANYKEELKQSYDVKCDMFSVGIILHTLLFHSSVFYGKKFNEVLQKNKECNIDFNAKLYQDTPAVTMNFMKALLEKDPVKRMSSKEALEHEFFNEEDEEDQQIRKKAGSWTIANQAEKDQSTSSGLTENQSPKLGNGRKRSSTEKQNPYQFKQANQPNGNTPNNNIETNALNSFNNALSQDYMGTSFQCNQHNMFQANMTSGAKGNANSDGQKNVNMIDSANCKFSIEIGSSPQIKPEANPDANDQELRKQSLLNRVLEEEEDNESPNIRQKMKNQQKDLKNIGPLDLLDRKEKFSEAEKEFNNFLKLSKVSQSNTSDQKNKQKADETKSQEFDKSVELENENDENKKGEKDKRIFDFSQINNEQQNNPQELFFKYFVEHTTSNTLLK